MAWIRPLGYASRNKSIKHVLAVLCFFLWALRPVNACLVSITSTATVSLAGLAVQIDMRDRVGSDQSRWARRHDILSPIQPAGAIHTPKSLLIDSFPAILALDHVLDDGIFAEILVQASQSIQGHAEAEKVDGFVEKDTIFLTARVS